MPVDANEWRTIQMIIGQLGSQKVTSLDQMPYKSGTLIVVVHTIRGFKTEANTWKPKYRAASPQFLRI